MDCPLCGTTLPADRPRYQISLRTTDETRASDSVCHDIDQKSQICERCWASIKEDVE